MIRRVYKANVLEDVLHYLDEGELLSQVLQAAVDAADEIDSQVSVDLTDAEARQVDTIIRDEGLAR